MDSMPSIRRSNPSIHRTLGAPDKRVPALCDCDFSQTYFGVDHQESYNPVLHSGYKTDVPIIIFVRLPATHLE